MDEVIAVTDTSAANSADIASEYAKLVEKVRYAKRHKLAPSYYGLDKSYYSALGELTEYILLHPRFSDLLFASSADSAGTTAISSTAAANGGDAVSTDIANGGDAVSTDDANGADAVSTDIANGGNAVSTDIANGRDAVSTDVVNSADAVSTDIANGADAVSTDIANGRDAVSSTDVASAVINYSAHTITVDCHVKFNYRGMYYTEFIKCKCRIGVIREEYTLGMMKYCAQLMSSGTGDTICNISWLCNNQMNCVVSNAITIMQCLLDSNKNGIQLKFDTEYDYNHVVDFTPNCSIQIYEKLLRYKYDNERLTELRTSDAAHYSTSTIALQQQCSTQCAQIEELTAQITVLTREKEAAQHSCKQETAAYKLTQAAYNKASDNATYWKQQYYSVLDMYTTAQTDIATLYTQNTTNTSQITELSAERDKLTDANTQLKSQLADLARKYEDALYHSNKYQGAYFDIDAQLALKTTEFAKLYSELDTTKSNLRASDEMHKASQIKCGKLTEANAVLQSQLDEQQFSKMRLYQRIKLHQDTYTKLAKQYAENLVKSAANATAYSEYVILQEQRHALLQ
jgi:hypothetical protein